LEGTRAEVLGAARLLRSAGRDPRTLLGREADEPSVRAVRRPAVLHLATHGFLRSGEDLDELLAAASGPPHRADAQVRGVGGVRLSAAPGLVGDPADPALTALSEALRLNAPLRRCGVALAGANNALVGGRPPGPDDGLLTADEVVGMDLHGTRLVVLSACDTGLGEVRHGEGVYGLRRSFAAAGAENLIMSLWAVDDEQTRRLMTYFYEAFARGDAPPRALVAAQRRYLAEERAAGRAPDPRHWAAFVCSGIGAGLEPDAAPPTRPSATSLPTR
jgi:CHAT domain-containing protein